MPTSKFIPPFEAKKPELTYVYKEADYATATNPEYRWDNTNLPGCMTEVSMSLRHADWLIEQGAHEVDSKDKIQTMR